MSISEHLAELANRLKIVVVALLVTSSICFLPTNLDGFSDPLHSYQPIISILMQKIRRDFLPSGATLIALPMKIGGGSGAPARVIAVVP